MHAWSSRIMPPIERNARPSRLPIWRRWFRSFGIAWKENPPPFDRLVDLRKLESEIGYSFQDKEILNRALSHRSYAHDNGKGSKGSYERLEFLGDAVIGMVISEELFKAHPELMEGDLTKIKSILVSRSSLARCSGRIHLKDYLLFTGGTELMEGKSRVTILADGFEALVGAMYLDGGLEVVKSFLDRNLITDKDSITADHGLHSTKSNLLQLSQERFRTQPTYKVVKTSGPEHNKIFTCEVRVAGKWVAQGVGSSKKEAEKVAALNALKKLSAQNGNDLDDKGPGDADSKEEAG